MKMGTFFLRRRGLFNLLVICALVIGFLPAGAQPVSAVSPNLVISQIYGGGGNTGATLTHDFMELYNLGNSPINLTGWSVQYASSAGSTWQKTDLSGMLYPGQYYLIQQAAGAGGTTALPAPDASGGIAMSATAGKVALVSNTTLLTGTCPTGAHVVDFVGFGAATNCFETAPTPNLSNTTAALRKLDGAQDTDNNSADFLIGAPFPRNRSYGFDPAPYVISVTPANGAIGVSLDAQVLVTFSEAVDLASEWFTFTCNLKGTVSASTSGGPVDFVVTPDEALLEDDSCTFTVLADAVTDQDEVDPFDAMLADFSVIFAIQTSVPVCEQPFTPIYEIQGSGASTPKSGQTVTTQGVVVGDYEGPSPNLRGFFMQDLLGDGNDETSDGVFIFNGNNDSVNLGQVVRVTGTAGEFEGQTQLSNVSSIISCGEGSVEPVDVVMPFSSDLERYEGMLVRFPQTLYVTEHFQLGRFGQVVMSSGGRLQQPTNMVEPGPAAFAMQAANDLNKIIVDDATNIQNPDPILFGRGGNPLSAENTLRGGDTATGMVGVMTYTWAGNSASGNAYRLRPVGALGGGVPDFQAVNDRPAGPEDVGGTLKVTGFNLLNYFNTFTGCLTGVGTPPLNSNCRGAENATEFERQAAKTVAALLAMDADIIGIIEIENDGYGPTSAIQDLVNRLNAATAPGTYAFIDADAGTGQVNALGTDAIKVGFLYKATTVEPTGETAALNTVEFVNGGDGSPRNRPALAQAFLDKSSGRVLTVAVNHLKSKGSACDLPDQGDGQGNCNQVRLNSALLLAEWLLNDPTGTGDTDILIVGDLNSYAKEDPIMALEEFGFQNLILDFVGPDAYSYVFDGQWGYLDHALASPSLAAQVTGVIEFHINSDEPNVLDYNTNFKSPGQVDSLYAPDMFRSSDHDPVLVGIELANTAPVVGEIQVTEDPQMINTLIPVSVEFTDADRFDTHTAVWEWGDGTSSGGMVVEDEGAGTVTGSHTYTQPGIYFIKVTVTDNFTNSGFSISHPVVIYDPNGGFVTGGGWIYSPAGAAGGSEAQGKAELGFVAKYQKNNAKPKGNVSFIFEEGNINFYSTGFDYLVVTADGKSAVISGTGVLNEVGNYKFTLWATDEPDTFRIRIWRENAKVTMVAYDNLMPQALSGGSIQIRTGK